LARKNRHLTAPTKQIYSLAKRLGNFEKKKLASAAGTDNITRL